MVKKILVILGSVLVLAVGVVWVGYALWRADRLETLVSQSEVIDTASGLIEYRIFGDSGPVALFIHGTPGGYDQYYAMKGPAFDQFRVLVPSRPGYLRTPLDVGRTPEEQADAYAALLKALDIDSVVAVGASGGAPSAIAFAAKYPEKTRALVGLMPLSHPENESSEQRGEPGFISRFLRSDFGRWFMLEVLMSDEDLAKRLLSDSVQRRVVGEPERLEQIRLLVRAAWPRASRRAGIVNDSKQKADLALLPIADVKVPTLIVHGTNDHNVDYQQSVDLAARIAGAELFTVEGGDHFVPITHQKEVAIRLNDFWKTLVLP